MNLKQLIKFGMEESSVPVIKNPILRAALEPRSTVPGPRNMYSQGQLVTPNVDGSRPGYAAVIKQGVQPGPGRAGKDAYDVLLSKRGQKIIKAVKEFNNLVLKDFNKGNLVNTKSFAQFAGKKYGHQLVKAQSDIAYIYPDVKEFKLQKLDTARDKLFRKLINEANQGEQFIDFPSIAKKISKTAPVVHTSAAYRKLLDTKSDKVKKVFNNMIKNDEPLHLVGKGHKHLWDANPLLKIIGQRADVKSAALMREALDTDPFYKKNKKLIKFAGDARLMDYGKPLSEILEQADYRIGGGVQWSYGTGKRPAKDVADTINDFALKHWNYHKRNQTGESQIEFFSKKNNKPINWEKVSKSPRTGVKSLISTDVYFKYKNDPKQSKWSVAELRKSGRDAGIFDEVYKTRYSYQNMMNKMVTNPVNPTGKKIKFGQLMSKVFKEGFDDASSPYAIDHIKGVANSPFNDLRLASTRTNFALSYINKHIPQKNFKKTLISELMGGATDFKSKQYVNDLVKHGEGLAKEVLVGGKKVPISSVQEVGRKFLEPSKFRELTGPQQEHIKRMSKADTYKVFKTLNIPKSEAGFIEKALLRDIAKVGGKGARAFTKWFGIPDAIIGTVDYLNERSKGKSKEEAKAQAIKNVTFGAIKDKEYMKGLKKTAESMGIDARAFDDVYKLNVAGQTFDKYLTKGQEEIKNLRELGYDKRADDAQKNLDKYIEEQNKNLGNLSQKVIGQISISKAGGAASPLQLSKARDILTEDDFYKPFQDITKVAKEKLTREKRKAFPTQKFHVDTAAGEWGEGFYKAFDALTQGAKNVLQGRIIPYGPERFRPLESERQKEARYLREMEPRELYLRNKARGYTYDQPTTEADLENLRYNQPGVFYSKGGRAGYMGGGIAAIRKPNAIPPERQGLRSIMINDKKS